VFEYAMVNMLLWTVWNELGVYTPYNAVEYYNGQFCGWVYLM